jgi:hypothetical protein
MTESTHKRGRSAFANLDEVLPPFADAMARYAGIVAIVALVGPTGEQGGDVVVRW